MSFFPLSSSKSFFAGWLREKISKKESKMWLPPLRERIAASELHPVDFKTAWQGAKQALEPVLGVVDIPSMQAQETLKINLTQEGHMAVFSSPGYGKSTLMQTVAWT
jgi:S-DNA-T family DNA segregation ATPase FtsK/SpoIIIE